MKHQENFTGRIIFMTMFNDISCGSRDNGQECLSNANLVFFVCKEICMQEDLEQDNGHLLILVLRKSGTRSVKTVHKEIWDRTAERMLVGISGTRLSNFPCYKSIVSEVDFKSKGHGKLSIHYATDLETIETIFRIIGSANQLSLYGAVAEICAKRTKRFATDRGNPLSKVNQVPHSC